MRAMCYCTVARRAGGAPGFFLWPATGQRPMRSYLPSPLRRLASATLTVMLALAPVVVTAATLGNLYESTVSASGTGDAARNGAFQEALRDVLVRVTGRRDAPAVPGLAALVSDARRYVQTFRSAPGGQLVISFDGNAIENAVAASGLPLWGAERPVLLVWLALDRGGGQRSLVGAAGQGEERRAVERAAAQRGLPLIWPALGPGDFPQQRLDDVQGGRTEPLTQAMQRYGADGVIIGRAAAGSAGGYTVDWSFTGEGGPGQVRGGLADGVHLAADRYAGQYASAAAARLVDVSLSVTAVTRLEDYAEVMRLLATVTVIRGLQVVEVSPESLLVRASVRGDADALRRALALRGAFVPVEGSAGIMTYQYRP